MKERQKSLQKFTESENKINKILKLEKIKPEDIKHLSKPELKLFDKKINALVNNSNDIERDKAIEKIDSIISNETRNQGWEYNHNKITWAISTLIMEYSSMPTKSEIALKTGLSRQTINKHLKEYNTHPLYLEQIEQFRFITAKLLAEVCHYALQGDMKAAKLYFNIIGNSNNEQPKNNTLIQNQNNYIQINSMVLSQETIKKLNTEQLNSIEDILKTALLNVKNENSQFNNLT